MRRPEMRYAIVAGAVALATSMAPAFAIVRTHHPSTKQITDQQFVLIAANANLAEIEVGMVAENRTANDEVKNFAKLMVADHEKALNDLKTVAKDQNITLPTTLDSKEETLKD